MELKKNKTTLILGITHVAIGTLILITQYVLEVDLVTKLSRLAATLPSWTLAVAGFSEGFYWISGIVPGVMYMLVYVIGQQCTLENNLTAVVLIWIGVALGIAVSYGSGFIIKEKNQRVFVAVPIKLKRIFMRLPFGFHPTPAAAYLFESGFLGRNFLSVFPPVLLGGAIALSLTVPFICETGDVLKNTTGTWGLLVGVGLIAWGSWKILKLFLSK